VVGVGGGEEVKVGAATAVGDNGLRVGDTVEAMDGVGKAGTSPPHPASKSTVSIRKTLEYLPHDAPAMRE